MSAVKLLLGAALALVVTQPALADCAADSTVAEVRQAYARGQQREQAGDGVGALGAYVAAQSYTCDPNPVAADAARRAMGLGRTLGDAATARGDHAAAFDLYERGGHFAKADRALLARIEAVPEDVQLYALALRHVRNRDPSSFQANEALRIGLTGPYTLDARLVATVAAMPERGAQRALAAEAAAFDEAWYARYLSVLQSRPEDLTDFAALQQFSARMQALQVGLKQDPLRAPLQAIDELRSWESQLMEPALAAKLARLRIDRATARAATLADKYAQAPALLDLAIDYLGRAGEGAGEAGAQQLRRQAERLGDAADAGARYQLAMDYFSVAGADAKAQATSTRQQAAARSRMQPSLETMQQQAAALQAQMPDPAQIAELQRQAQELQRSLQSANPQGKRAPTGRSADDLAAELGL
jgi:hypothetical protein